MLRGFRFLGVCVATFFILLINTSSTIAAPTITFYSNWESFQAAITSSTIIDFEGIVPPQAYSCCTESIAIGNVVFSAAQPDTKTDRLGIAGKNSGIGGQQKSAILFSNYGGAVTADVSIGGSFPNMTAIGGFFGDIDDGGGSATLSLIGRNTGLLDTQHITAVDMREGNVSAFYGWTIFGDTVGAVVFDLEGAYEGVDDFTIGTARTTPIPEPSSWIVLVAMIVTALRRQLLKASAISQMSLSRG